MTSNWSLPLSFSFSHFEIFLCFCFSSLIYRDVKVIRGGRQQEVKISQIFVGDVIIIDCGDQIPADGIIIQADEMTVDESVMTGETDSLPKSPHGDYRMLSGCQVTYFLPIILHSNS
jgi:magnesium-transporting ATPase (P-type)